MRTLLHSLPLAAMLVASASARAQAPRPNEDEMFGGTAQPAPPAAPAAPVESGGPQAAPTGPVAAPPPTGARPAAAASGTARDQALLGNPEAGPQLSTDVAPENPLTIGGQIYLRAQSTAASGARPDAWVLSAPNLLDVYFDARPNERVRAFVLGRVAYDPTAPPSGTSNSGVPGVPTGGLSATGFTSPTNGRGPNALLDQIWMSFDVEHKAFVTVGKQHVRWGTGRFWTPTDFLHPVKRNPLDVFDSRTGTSMLKVQLPWEARAWNFYLFGIYEDPNAATSTLRGLAGAGRAEIVEGPAELGLDFVVHNDQRPRLGADLSFGIGDFDFYGDMGIRWGSDALVVSKDPTAQPTTCSMSGDMVDPLITQQFTVGPSSGVKPQVVGGVTWSMKYNDNDIFTLGGEYFYNSLGYSDTSLYSGFIFNQQNIRLINPFYTGRHYAAVFASLPAPYSWNYTTFTLSTIGNFSDFSFVTRLDYSVTFLTHLTFQAFVAGHYGNLGGEFRLGFDIPAQKICDAMGNSQTISDPVHIPAPIVDFGVALQLKI